MTVPFFLENLNFHVLLRLVHIFRNVLYPWDHLKESLLMDIVGIRWFVPMKSGHRDELIFALQCSHWKILKFSESWYTVHNYILSKNVIFCCHLYTSLYSAMKVMTVIFWAHQNLSLNKFQSIMSTPGNAGSWHLTSLRSSAGWLHCQFWQRRDGRE